MYKIQLKEGNPMFIKTIKVKKPTAALGGILVLVIAIIAVALMIVHKLGNPAVYELKTESDRQSFIKEMGWQVSEEYEECKVVVIPEEFNDVYERSLVLQLLWQ